MATFPTMPNMPDSGGFPGVDNVRVWEQYKSDFDYTRWKADTQILLCSVPWDGENNVVKFADDDERNEWFANATGYRDVLQTEMRILPDGMIKVPVPFDGSGLFNYCWVTFPIATGDGKALDYEPSAGVRHWGFFIDDLKFRSPSCTELRLTVDYWTTFINGVAVKSLQLNRGHYALNAAASVSSYLSDPHAHTEWLNGVEPETVGEKVTNVKLSYLLNDDAPYLVFDVGAANEAGSFTDGVPYRGYHYHGVSGFPSGSMFAVALSDADTFAANAPAGLWQCVRAAYVVPGKWLSLSGTETVGGVPVSIVAGGASVTRDCKLTQADFGYDSDYAGLTKLYTSPYAYVHLVGDSGQDVMIAPETLGGTQDVRLTSELTAAGARILAHMNGVGASDVQNVTFQNMASHAFAQSGAWQKTLMQWDVPAFAVYQSSDELSDYRKQWTRAQARANASTAQANANASAATAQTNANASADTGKSNADASADTSLANTQRSTANMVTNANNNASNITSNNATTVSANSTVVQTSNTNATTGAGYSNTKLRTDVQYDIGNMNASFDAEQAYLSTSQANNNAQAATQGVTGVINGAVSTIASALTGNIAGAVGSAVSTVTGAVNQGVSWGATNAAITISMSNNASVYNQSVTSAYGKQNASIAFNNSSTSLNNSTASSNATTQNNASTTIAGRNASLARTNAANTQSAENANASAAATTTKSNATRTQSTAKANAQRTYDTSVANAQRSYDNAIAAVNNGIGTDNAQAPISFGAIGNAANNATRPMEVQVKIERATDDDIARCGDSFYRYGYCCSRNVRDFTGFNVMRHFTYWQCDEVWMTANGKAPESAMQQIRGILETGVTVWKDPDEIGAVSIYDN